MDADQIRQLQPKLRKHLKQFRDCFASHKSRGHLQTYVEGQLSNLPRKSRPFPDRLRFGKQVPGPSRWRSTCRREPCNSFSIPWRGTKSK